ncbi:hypothetical protein KY334_01685 [Candidatus Woesearchaeota archaeon]|nr:hypothetical protein [Candidatus Woesearchaeota archaeon]
MIEITVVIAIIIVFKIVSNYLGGSAESTVRFDLIYWEGIELVAYGNVIREKKKPNDMFLNIFPGKKIATCRSEKVAKKLVEEHNAKIK